MMRKINILYYHLRINSKLWIQELDEEDLEYLHNEYSKKLRLKWNGT
jgi:hypothetical protein